MDLTQTTKAKKKSLQVYAAPVESSPISPVAENYDLVSAPQAESDKQNAELFVTPFLGLKLYVMRAISANGVDGYVSTNIEFRDGMFRTEDESIIDALRAHPSYGGSNLVDYKDRPPVAREPLFYHGSFPVSLKAKLDKEAASVTRDPTEHEDPMRVY
jgi:hypothetical protein